MLDPRIWRVMVAAAILSVVLQALASECDLCKKAIPPGKGVAAKIGKTTKHFRCIHCALTGLKGERKTFTISAKTPLDRKTVTLTHGVKGWSQQPPGTVFLILPERANECLDVHQPFTSKAEFERYLKKHPEIASQKPKAYTIAQYEQMIEAGKG
jgi:hypothetical protein